MDKTKRMLRPTQEYQQILFQAQSNLKSATKSSSTVEKYAFSKKRARQAQHDEVEIELLKFCSMRGNNVPKSSPLMKAKATTISVDLGKYDLRWLVVMLQEEEQHCFQECVWGEPVS